MTNQVRESQKRTKVDIIHSYTKDLSQFTNYDNSLATPSVHLPKWVSVDLRIQIQF